MFELINKNPIGQLYETEFEQGESGSTEHSTFSIHFKHYIAYKVLGKLEPYPKK